MRVLIPLTALLLAACTQGLSQSDNTVEQTEPTTQTADALTGEWIITTINGDKTTRPESVPENMKATLTFSEDSVSATAFCNLMGSNFTAGDGTLETQEMLQHGGLIVTALLQSQAPPETRCAPSANP